MKRFVSMVCSLALLISMLSVFSIATPVMVSAGVTKEELVYAIGKDGGIQITDYTGTATELVIPSVIKVGPMELPVTGIAEEAFRDCTTLEKITIPDSVTSIGRLCFYNTAYYNNDANWEQDVLYIGKHLIQAKTTLAGEYVVKAGTNCIADYAFLECDLLTSLKIADSVTHIGSYAVSCCNIFTSITVPASVKRIDSFAFYSNMAWDVDGGEVYITDIAAWCAVEFADSDACPLDDARLYLNGELVTDLVIPDGVPSVNAYAFRGYKYMESVTVADSVTSIGTSAFSGCSSLRNVILSNCLNSIGYRAFFNCRFTTIQLPDGLTTIYGEAFVYCNSLEVITIPNSVTFIGESAFGHCESLTDVYYEGSQTQWNEITIGSDNDCLINATLHFVENMSGDLTGDRVINIADATMVFRAVNGRVMLTEEENRLADLNSDGVVDIADATKLFRYVNGRINSLDE